MIERITMPSSILTPEQLKQTVRQAVDEALRDREGVLHEMIEEIVEDIGLTNAMREAEGKKLVSRQEVFEALETDQ
jgi:hypothetical protein